MNNDMIISWQQNKAEGCSTPYRWLPQFPEAHHETIEKDLDSNKIDQKVLSYIYHALKLGLKRKQIWDLSSLEQGKEREAAIFAASVYRRGVPVIPLMKSSSDLPMAGTYAIRFHSGTPQFAVWLGKFVAKHSPIIVADQNLKVQFARAEITPDVYLRAHEREKTIESVNALCQIFQKKAAHRSHCLIVGGGIICDTAAFAANISGLSFHLVPSSLLAMVDASVGGKSGVNVAGYGKNLIGSFAFPSGLDVFPEFLESLPDNEIASAGAECLKHTFLSHNYEYARKISEAISQRNLKTLTQALPKLIAVKAGIVSQDPFEQGKRAVLNFGHTLGHALESISQEKNGPKHPLRHGEGVAIGMLFALHISKAHENVNLKSIGQMQDLIKQANIIPKRADLEDKVGLGLTSKSLIQSILSYMQHDKKNEAGIDEHIAMILIRDWACVLTPSTNSYTVKVSLSKIEEFLRTFLKDLGGLI